MKKNLILLLAVFVLAGCKTSNRAPDTGMGEYGFTFDLDNSPSPFRDTSYRPLTVRDLSKPIIITPTNQITLNLVGPDLAAPDSKPEVPRVLIVNPSDTPPATIVVPVIETPATPPPAVPVPPKP